MANVRLAALGRLSRPRVRAACAGACARGHARRAMSSSLAGRCSTPVLDRNGLEIGDAVAGPAVIEESTATTLVPPGWTATVIEGGHLSMTLEAGS